MIAVLTTRANKEYLYWDDFKYKGMPEGITPEEAWEYLKISRLHDRTTISFTNKASFSWWIPSSLYEHIHFIDKNSAGNILVSDAGVVKEERERYLIRSLAEEAIASSQIEGAATTRAVAKEMFRSGRAPRNHAEKMIFNNYMTMQKIKDKISETLSVSLLNELHALISKDTLDDLSWEGRLRTEQNEVHDPEDRVVLYTPPPASEVKDAIERLCEFANDTGDTFIHPIIKGVILHFWLAWIHPYMDGNGRLSRALFYWYMLKQGYWLFEIIPISTVIRKTRTHYIRSFLYSEIDENDLTYFIVYNLRAIREAIDDVHKYIGRKERGKKASIDFLKKYPELNLRQRALLASALEKPDEVYTFQAHARVNGIVYQSARTDLFGLQRLGLLEMRKQGRKMLFYPSKGLREKLLGM